MRRLIFPLPVSFVSNKRAFGKLTIRKRKNYLRSMPFITSYNELSGINFVTTKKLPTLHNLSIYSNYSNYIKLGIS